MKYSSVKELKYKIMQPIEDDDKFEAQLFTKYPALLPRDEDGNLLPQSQRCYNDCPDGWKHIVESLFACIDDYIKNHKYTEVNPKRKLQLYARKVYWKYVRDPVYRKFNPYRDFEKRLPKGAKFISPTDEERAKINKTFASRIRSLVSAIDGKFFNRHDLYIGVSPPPVVIAQYKEKFGTLRVYYDGGNDVVRGMVRYAEHLSSITCQDTGKTGQLCRRGGWYATLSKVQAKKQGYKPVEENI
jgi:hypothetical protein